VRKTFTAETAETVRGRRETLNILGDSLELCGKPSFLSRPSTLAGFQGPATRPLA
jgi:hypothetical protein